MTYSFTVPGIPKGQPRPRATRIGGFIRLYDPASAKSHKADVAAFARAAGVVPIEGPVSVAITAMMQRPKRLCRKSDPDGAIPALCKPDVDNIAKAVCDALIGVAYADDAAVVSACVAKFYHAKNGTPETRIVITRFTRMEAPEFALDTPSA